MRNHIISGILTVLILLIIALWIFNSALLGWIITGLLGLVCIGALYATIYNILEL